MPIERPYPGAVLRSARALLTDVRNLLAADPADTRLLAALAQLEAVETELESYADQARPLPPGTTAG